LVAYWRVPGIRKVRKELGANVRSFRKKAGLSQERLAEKADLHPVYISQVERGTKAVSVEALWKLSRALQVRMSVLFRGI
jgi:XRE family transcriptional regulator, regulator of sulfur utilization